MKHSWRIKKVYYDQLFHGEKHYEVRVGYGWVKKVRPDDTIIFPDYSELAFQVQEVQRFEDFQSLLASIPAEQIVPHHGKEDVLDILQSLYPPDKEALGVYAIKLLPPTATILSASKSLENKLLFNKLISLGYKMTDWISEDYPKHLEHYYTKYVPGIFNGTREILIATVSRTPAGVVILKKDDELKISTLFVEEKFRGLGVASKLLDASYGFLGTSKPLITIAEYKLPQFKNIIERDGWEHTQTLSSDYYGGKSREFVFNGKI